MNKTQICVIITTICLLLNPISCFEISRLSSFDDNGFGFEVVFIGILILSVINFIHGKAQNRSVAINFFSETIPILYKNFALLGENSNLTIEPSESQVQAKLKYFPCEKMMNPKYLSGMIEQDSNYYFRMFCTGRKNIAWAFLDVQTRRRQDLLTNLFYNIVIPENDKVSVELKISNGDIKAVSYILKNKNVKKCLEEFKDLKQLCRRFGLLKNKYLSVFCENEDILRCIYKEDIVKTLERNCFLVESLDLTDCLQDKIVQGVFLRLTFNLFNQRKFLRMQKKYVPENLTNLPSTNWEAYQELIEMILRVGDNLMTLKVKAKNREEMEAKRKILKSGKTKDELKQEQLDNQQKLREERLKKMSRAEKEKFLEKEKKRRKNKMMKKFKVVKSG
jgi:hypothetical protein